MHKSTLELAEETLSAWLDNKNDSPTKDPRMPRHPGFHYRKTGDWTSWNDFLGIPENTDTFRANEAIDLVENQAWQLYVQRYSN